MTGPDTRKPGQSPLLLSNLPVASPRHHDEGVMGYRLRLAGANLISVAEMMQIHVCPAGMPCPLCSRHWGQGARVGADSPHAESGPVHEERRWVTGYSPVCAKCFLDRRIAHESWEILFVDVCTLCGSRLRDRCAVCNARLTWKRSHLLFCDCGAPLFSSASQAAPPNSVLLSKVLYALVKGEGNIDIPVLRGLDFEQATVLVRLFGAYAATGRALGNKAGLVSPRTGICWPVSAEAAEILAGWPASFPSFLSNLLIRNEGNEKRGIQKAFGTFYVSFRHACKDPALGFLQQEFDSFVLEHWGVEGSATRGFVAKAAPDNMRLVSDGRAAQLLGVKRKRLRRLISDANLATSTRLASTGKAYIVLPKSDLPTINRLMKSTVNATTARKILGLEKNRFASILPFVCPKARKSGAGNWLIPVEWLERWRTLLSQQNQIAVKPGTATIDHVLRYWAWSEAEVAQFLRAVQDSEITPMGCVSGDLRVTALVFEVSALKNWHDAAFASSKELLFINDFARAMKIKGEVAYHLVAEGIVSCVKYHGSRRVPVTELNDFHRKYVWGRELAKQWRVSPKKLAIVMRQQGIEPVTGPGKDTGRQLLYSLSDVQSLGHLYAPADGN